VALVTCLLEFFAANCTHAPHCATCTTTCMHCCSMLLCVHLRATPSHHPVTVPFLPQCVAANCQASLLLLPLLLSPTCACWPDWGILDHPVPVGFTPPLECLGDSGLGSLPCTRSLLLGGEYAVTPCLGWLQRARASSLTGGMGQQRVQQQFDLCCRWLLAGAGAGCHAAHVLSSVHDKCMQQKLWSLLCLCHASSSRLPTVLALSVTHSLPYTTPTSSAPD
jgi:hypothetical protein